MVIQPLSLPEMYVVAVLLKSGEAGLDGPSIAREALACCAQLISVTAGYGTLDRLEQRHLVTWEQAGEGCETAGRSKRRCKVTTDGRKVFDRSLGIAPVDDRARIALKSNQARGDGRSRSGRDAGEDT